MKIHWVWTSVLIVFLIGLNIWGFCYLSQENSKVAILGISGAILAAVTSVFTVVVNNNSQKQREHEFIVFKEKQKVFSIYYDYFFTVLRDVKSLKKDDSDPVQLYLEFKKGILNWASSEFIEEFLKYDSLVTDPENQTKGIETTQFHDEFIRAIRKELGLETSEKLNLIDVILDRQARLERKFFFKGKKK